MILDPNSLVNTLDHVNKQFLHGETIPMQEGLDVAHWILTRQGQKGAYRGMFAPTPADFELGIRTFTGERLASASARHILGQEAARAVWLLGSSDATLRAAYERATVWMQSNEGFQQTGFFCCGRCTLAFWRNYWVGDFPNKAVQVEKGLQTMKSLRIGDGKWQRMPFYYAIYTLLGLDLEPAVAELAYARLRMETALKSMRTGDYSQRRMTILTQALDKIS